MLQAENLVLKTHSDDTTLLKESPKSSNLADKIHLRQLSLPSKPIILPSESTTIAAAETSPVASLSDLLKLSLVPQYVPVNLNPEELTAEKVPR
ncbi:MAG: hypothetical protein ACQKBV_13795, partial [Puniceicoccales bacterium]